MKIFPSYNSGTLTIAVHGRVDSSVAQTFQNEVNAIIDDYISEKHLGINDLIIDARNMDFISSSGLRVFLLLRRKFKDMRVTCCSAEVFNVFKMTGFNHMITVEKVLPQISLEGLTPISGHDDLFALTDDTMLKVFPEGTTEEDVDRIVKLTKRVFVLDINTPMTFEKKQLADKIALVYERVTPTEIDPKSLANLLHELHKYTVELGDTIPSASARIREQIQRMSPYLGEPNTTKLKKIFMAFPEESYLLHGNLSLNKIASCNGELMIMDMGDLCYGNPMIDLAHLYSSLTSEKKGQFFDDFIHEYYDLASEEAVRMKEHNIKTLSLIFDYTNNVLNGELSVKDREYFRSEFKSKVAHNWISILSSLHFKSDVNEELNKLVHMRFYTDCDIDIDWIADKLAINRHYVSDYFNKVLHTSFTDYINNLRLDYAVELMRSGKVPMSQIPYTVGFTNDHTFRRVFKKRYGKTPIQSLK